MIGNAEQLLKYLFNVDKNRFKNVVTKSLFD